MKYLRPTPRFGCHIGILTLAITLTCGAAFGQQGRIVNVQVHGAALEKNLTGEAVDRNVAIYLPPSYDSTPTKRYPVVYLLHGIGDTEKEFNHAWDGQTASWGTIGGLMDNGIVSGRFGEMIIVMPDERTKMLGSFYTNSSVTGAWEDFTVKDLVAYIDRTYRTLSTVNSRGIAGHSMGGYGAIKLGMRHPEIFSVVYGMNPALLGWAGDVSVENPVFNQLLQVKTIEQVMQGGPYAAAAICVAQAFSPAPENPPLYAMLPFKLVDGKLLASEPAFQAWQDNMPLFMAEAYKSNLQKLRAIRFDTAWEDEFTHIPATTRALSKKLTQLGIDHTFEEYNGNHRNRMWGSTGRLYTTVLPFFWQMLDKSGPNATHQAKNVCARANRGRIPLDLSRSNL